jgi:hypothetical protein
MDPTIIIPGAPSRCSSGNVVLLAHHWCAMGNMVLLAHHVVRQQYNLPLAHMWCTSSNMLPLAT